MPGPAQHARGRTPTRIPARALRKRSAGDVLAGIGALALLLILVGGVPWALLTFVGPPISPVLLDLDLLTSRIGPSTLTALLVLLVWLAWLQLFVCVVVEVYAGVRRVGMPARVPLSGGTQALANKLVTAALVLFTASAAVAPIARLAGPPPAMPPVTSVAFTAPVVEQQAAETQKTKKVYVVQPPHGRHHESLWEIAEKCLGDGRRYPEIFRLNQHKEQPDGSRLRMADLIRPGWVLDMPDDARNTHIVPAGQPRSQILKEHPGPPSDHPAEQRRANEQAGKPADQGKKGEHRKPGRVQEEDRREAKGQRQADQGQADQGQEDPVPEARAAESPLLDVLAGLSLAAAGLLALLAVRRREQLWQRITGRRVARPQGDAADAEVALRFGADTPGARILDLGLRQLGTALAAQGRTPPTVYAAHLSAHSLDLWVHPADEHPPAPWTADDGGQVWRLSAKDGRMLDAQPGGAPYPGLVSIGTDRIGRVLVDLEAARGLINIRGPQTTAALAALAVELATNRWSDRMRVTLVGFGQELTAIAPDRVRAVGSLAEVLPELEANAAPRAEVLTGRITGRPGVAHYLLSAVAPTHEEARRLALLARDDSAGYVVAGDVPHATWTWEITEDGTARLPELGFEVKAQLLPRRHYRALVELFRTADRRDGERIPGPEPLPDLRPPAVEIRMLGPVEIAGPRPLEEGRMALAAELLVYLATHPGGVHPAVLGGVLWPRGVQPMVRDATIARVASWLGSEHLRVDESGRLSLGPGVRTDWALFRELVRRSHGDPATGTVLLEKALGLVRGPLLANRPPGRYAWLAAEPLEYDVAAEVADAARRLCEIRLAEGAPDAAMAAVRAALLLAADDESLWRDLLRAAHATGDLARLRAVIEGLTRRAAGVLAPETEALIDELLPSWRVHLVRESTA